MSTELGNLVTYPHHRLRHAGLDPSGEHVQPTEEPLRDLDDVLGPEQRTAGHDLSTRHLHQRAERKQQTLTHNATCACTDFAGEQVAGQVEHGPRP